MTDRNLHRVKLLGIISIKPKIEPIEIILEESDSPNFQIFKLHYKTSIFDRFLDELKGNYHLESSCFIEFEVPIKEIPISSSMEPRLVIELIGKINKIIDSIRYSYSNEYPLVKIHLRNIGIEDFLFYRIDIDGKHEISSAKDNFTNKERELLSIKTIQKDVPFEWSTLQKAIDLLERGLYEESLLISFSILDYCVQKTIKSKLTHLDEKEKEELLRQIKEHRIKTYIGPLLKSLTGISIYDQKLTAKKVDKVNSLRNSMIHTSEKCTYHESLESLKTIHLIIRTLNLKFNQDFKIPLTFLFIEPK